MTDAFKVLNGKSHEWLEKTVYLVNVLYFPGPEKYLSYVKQRCRYRCFIDYLPVYMCALRMCMYQI